MIFQSNTIRENLLLIFISIVTCSIALAQNVQEPIHSRDLYNKGVELYEQEKYAESLVELEKIDRNDTLYTEALLQKSVAYLKLEKYDKGAEVCREGILLNSEKDHSFYNNLGVILNAAKKSEEAMKAIDEGLKKYPKNYLLYFNKGTIYRSMKKIPQAIEAYKASILLNPYYESSHLYLGLIAAEEGKVSQAMLSLSTYLILDPTSARSLTVIKKLNDIVSSKYERTPENVNLSPEGGDDFEETDLIITNYAALAKDYKIPVKVELPAIKQCYALFSKLEYNKKDKGFWMQTYAPLYKEIMSQNQFPGFAYYCLQASQNDEHIKQVKKNKSLITQFANWVPDYLNKIQQTRLDNFEGKMQEVEHFYGTETHTLGIVGHLDQKEKKLRGYVEIYYPHGVVKSKGTIGQSGERDGHWSFYDYHGALSSESTYSNGISNGPFKVYYEDGTLEREGTYLNDKQNGSQKEYNKAGKLESNSSFKDDQYDGKYITYFKMGEDFKHYVGKYALGKLIDTLYEYYDDKSAVATKKVISSNEVFNYYRNGKLISKYKIINEKHEGPYLQYDINGKIEEQGQYKEGQKVGKWLLYSDGKLIGETNYDDKGKHQGTVKEYNSEGKVFSEIEYSKDILVGYKFYNKDGKILKEDHNLKGGLAFVGFSEEGIKDREGSWGKTSKKGLWKFYDAYGNLSSEETYNETGELQGKSRLYYKNGQLKEEINFEKGERDGHNITYYSNGKISEEGWNAKGLRQGYWYTFQSDGTPKSKTYYLNNELRGYQEFFRVTGKLENEEFYEEGMLKKNTFYDTLGKVQNTILLPNGTGTYTSKHTNNKTSFESQYILGAIHGKAVWYNYDGILTSNGSYHNDERHGAWKWYDEKGQLLKEGNYYYGKRDGKWISYYSNGKTYYEETYNKGISEGEKLYYYENGVLTYKKTYKDDVEEGKAFYYDETGELQLVKDYHKGKVMSYTYNDASGKLKAPIDVSSGTYKCITYYKNGNKAMEYEVIKGQYQGKFIEYHSNGNISEKITFKDNEYDGLYVSYYQDGKIKHEINYLMGEVHGLYKIYLPDGKLEKKENYRFDVLHGDCEYYNKSGKLTKKAIYNSGDVIKQQIF